MWGGEREGVSTELHGVEGVSAVLVERRMTNELLHVSDRTKVQALFARALQGEGVTIEALTADPAMPFPVLRTAPGAESLAEG